MRLNNFITKIITCLFLLTVIIIPNQLSFANTNNTMLDESIIPKLYDYISIQPIFDFNLAWRDKGSGGVHDGALYKPVIPNGYFAVGYYGQTNYNPPNGFVFAVKPNTYNLNAIAYPIGYKKVWCDRGSGAYMDGCFWEPIPPAGYVAMGMVVTSGFEPPLSEVVCIKKEYVLKAKVGSLVWNDKGTGSYTDFGSWRIQEVIGGISPGTFFGITSHIAPSDNNLLWCFNPKYIY